MEALASRFKMSLVSWRCIGGDRRGRSCSDVKEIEEGRCKLQIGFELWEEDQRERSVSVGVGEESDLGGERSEVAMIE